MSTYSSLLKQATWLGRQINNVFGQDTFMGRTFGESNATAAENFYRSQEAPGEREARQRAAAAEDARVAAINAHIDRGLAQANQRLAQGRGVTQQPGYQAPQRAVAAKPAAPAARPAAQQTRTAPPPTAARTARPATPQSNFQNQLNPATRSAAGAKNLAASDAAIRRRDAAKVTGRPNPYAGRPR